MADDGTDVAQLTVGGNSFQDWESVWIQVNRAEAFAVFRFVAAERDTQPIEWTKLQFKPGDHCTITLGGASIIDGVITTRQTAYDANSHQTMLVGKSLTQFMAKSSMDSKTGSFDGMTFEQVARKVLAPFPSGVEVIGKLDPTPFEKLQNQPGEKVWDFLERIARPRGVIMGSDAFGNTLLIGDHDKSPNAELVEGVNILKCQCVINDEHTFEKFIVRGQGAGNDQSSGADKNEIESDPVKGSAKFYCLNLTSAEQPVKDKSECNIRAMNEAVWNEGTIINCTIVTRGWFRPSGGLWQAGDVVTVNSPMALLNGVSLAIQSVTFQQDSQSGTTSTLDLVPPFYLKINSSFGATYPGTQQPQFDTQPYTLPDVQQAIQGQPPTQGQGVQ
jgi:prophage tail gpP-like protein